jgi:hypothetical protein
VQEHDRQAKGAPLILCFATQGHTHTDAERIRVMCEQLEPEEYPFERENKVRSALGLLRRARSARPQLIIMEGTGTAGGVPLLLCRGLLGIPYVVSSGDAVGPFLGLSSRLMGMLGGVYERLLCRFCAGFVGWTPYLAGRAMTYGAPRAMTAPGWTRNEPRAGARAEIRGELGLDEATIAIGLAGSLNWNERVRYGYGLEIVKAVLRAQREDLVACLIGDGDGRGRLEELAGAELGKRVIFTGRVAPERVPDYLSALDIGSLSQSVDPIGMFRYTTKLSEYLAAGLPVVSGEVPAAYDLDEGYMWRLPGSAPWSETYVEALAELLRGITREEIERRRAAALAADRQLFDRASQQRRMLGFVGDILAASSRG